MGEPKPRSRRRRRPLASGPGAGLLVLGWREWVCLPDLGVDRIKAKIDTGARSSALHAFDIQIFQDGERLWRARFSLHPLQRETLGTVAVEVPVQEFRRVRSSTGHMEMRPVIRTTLRVMGIAWPIDLTLARRDEMGFRLLLGRGALRDRFLVHPGRSFLARKKRRKKKRPSGQSTP